jgi:PPM family protein phosphatase
VGVLVSHAVLGGEPVVGSSARSDRGRVRLVNEDSVLATHPIYLVADGMGGHEHGERASQAIVAAFATLAGTRPLSQDLVLSALQSANTAVHLLNAEAHGASIAGSTVAGVALVLDVRSGSHYWLAFNVGDSRVYEWADGALTQLTVDHSAVQELVDSGAISAAEAASHPQRNVITRAVGVSDVADPDIWLLPAGGNQIFLICSDGLHTEVSDARIAELLRSWGDDESVSIADMLVEAALEAGGADNVSVVVVDSTSPQPDTGSGLAEFREETLPRG